MRSLVFVAAVGLSSLAQAYPAIGDLAAFEGTVSVSGQVMPAQIAFEITGRDAATGEWTQTQTTTVGNASQKESSKVKADDVTDRQTVLTVLANCGAMGGKSGTMNTPAGSFNSCALKIEEPGNATTFYIADVPFGVAAFDADQNGTRVIMKLKSFAHGK